VNPGDVALLFFPFTSVRGGKKRPVLVLGATPPRAPGDEAILVAMITTKRVNNPRPGDIWIPEWQKANLLSPSAVRARRLFSAERRDFYKVLGTVETTTLEQARGEARSLIA
jgi:PemK-like, MazF-like toxin of type II toxin-antitoxin system